MEIWEIIWVVPLRVSNRFSFVVTTGNDGDSSEIKPFMELAVGKGMPIPFNLNDLIK